jgi:hypothetical protein
VAADELLERVLGARPGVLEQEVLVGLHGGLLE